MSSVAQAPITGTLVAARASGKRVVLVVEVEVDSAPTAAEARRIRDALGGYKSEVAVSLPSAMHAAVAAAVEEVLDIADEVARRVALDEGESRGEPVRYAMSRIRRRVRDEFGTEAA